MLQNAGTKGFHLLPEVLTLHRSAPTRTTWRIFHHSGLCFVLIPTCVLDAGRRAKILTAKDPTTLTIESGDFEEDFEAESRMAAVHMRQARVGV